MEHTHGAREAARQDRTEGNSRVPPGVVQLTPELATARPTLSHLLKETAIIYSHSERVSYAERSTITFNRILNISFDDSEAHRALVLSPNRRLETLKSHQ